jgi:DNA-binding transcriptional regulator YiaG
MNLTKELVDSKRYSKYAIANKLNVSWNTVSFWYKGVFKPCPENQEKLMCLVETKREENGTADTV